MEVGHQDERCFGKMKQPQSPRQRIGDNPDELHHLSANLPEKDGHRCEWHVLDLTFQLETDLRFLRRDRDEIQTVVRTGLRIGIWYDD